MEEQLPANAPRPRMCHVRKKFPEQEYGFNLHAERGKGQYIGSVDPESPAEQAGLRPSDRIFAVNGAVIINEDHKRVVSRIKEHPLECRLLVIDEEGETWYREMGYPITPDMPNILFCPSDYSSDQNFSAPMPSPTPPHYVTAVPDPPDYDNTPAVISARSAVRPRLCKVHKRTLEDEYGFNLHAEKGKGHFIGKVDDGSLAQNAGLEEGQRIVGVNHTLIYPLTPHKEVVSLIKKDPMSAELLVASPEVDEWFRSQNLPFSFEDAETVCHDTPPPLPDPAIMDSPTDASRLNVNGHTSSVNGDIHKEHPENGRSSTTPSISSSSKGAQEVTVITVTETPQPPSDGNCYPVDGPIKVPDGRRDSFSSTSTGGQSTGSDWRRSPNIQNNDDTAELGDLFSLSAAEMRERLTRKKKAKSKYEHLTMEEKHKIVRNL